jgi:hypothetical protein
LQLLTVKSFLGGEAGCTTLNSSSYFSYFYRCKNRDQVYKTEKSIALPDVLILISGSTGNAIAVFLRHHRMLASISSKA